MSVDADEVGGGVCGEDNTVIVRDFGDFHHAVASSFGLVEATEVAVARIDRPVNNVVWVAHLCLDVSDGVFEVVCVGEGDVLGDEMI